MKIQLSQQICYNIQYIFYLHSKLLGGGIESMAITEAFGGEEMSLIYHVWLDHYNSLVQNLPTLFLPAEFRTGKTQLSHTLCGEKQAF